MGKFVELFFSFMLEEATGSHRRHRLGKQCSKGILISAVLLDILKHGGYQAQVKIKNHGAPEWLSRLGIQLLISAQVLLSQVVSLGPMLGVKST